MSLPPRQGFLRSTFLYLLSHIDSLTLYQQPSNRFAFQETLNLMKAEGWEFPPIRESGAMFEADVAPDWAEGTVCHRCRTEFGLVTRQHHCRACGQVFCGRCSSKTCVLPKFGIEKEVRNLHAHCLTYYSLLSVRPLLWRQIIRISDSVRKRSCLSTRKPKHRPNGIRARTSRKASRRVVLTLN